MTPDLRLTHSLAMRMPLNNGRRGRLFGGQRITYTPGRARPYIWSVRLGRPDTAGSRLVEAWVKTGAECPN